MILLNKKDYCSISVWSKVNVISSLPFSVCRCACRQMQRCFRGSHTLPPRSCHLLCRGRGGCPRWCWFRPEAGWSLGHRSCRQSVKAAKRRQRQSIHCMSSTGFALWIKETLYWEVHGVLTSLQSGKKPIQDQDYGFVTAPSEQTNHGRWGYFNELMINLSCNQDCCVKFAMASILQVGLGN